MIKKNIVIAMPPKVTHTKICPLSLYFLVFSMDEIQRTNADVVSLIKIK